ncbi:MAG: cysteine--tRNA ligase [Candidatus Aenigmatarchaeota archaeon]
MEIKIYNTLTRKIEIFKPQSEIIKIYVCGPTVYSHTHIGHARTFFVFDVFIRFLEYLGYKVKYARNITDVGHLSGELLEGEDKIVLEARKEKVSPFEIVDKYMFEFFECMDKLNMRRPNIQPRPSQLIPEILEAVDKLIEKGYAYVTENGIYYDVSKFENYGKLSGIKKEELIKHRIEPDPTKRNPADFALWKFVKDENYPLQWNSKYGKGFPGWHIECSIMNLKFLGETVDVHGGGIDLIFPHHENEIAQSEALTGKNFVNYWMHVNFLTINGEKMSKSKGNFLILKNVLEEIGNPEILRVFFLTAHYRSTIDYNEKALNDAKEILEKFYRTLDYLKFSINFSKGNESITNEVLKLKNEVLEALANDLNFPQALSKYIEMSNLILSKFESISSQCAKEAYQIFYEIGNKIFGLFYYYKPRIDEKLEQLINDILKIREELRKRGIYDLSDEIRVKLNNFGIEVFDTKEGPKWRIKL